MYWPETVVKRPRQINEDGAKRNGCGKPVARNCMDPLASGLLSLFDPDEIRTS